MELHVFIDRPEPDAMASLPRGARVLDLTIKPALSPRDVQVLRDAGVTWVRAPVATEACFWRARERVLEEHARLLGPDGPLRAALSDQVVAGLPLVWLLDFAAKHPLRMPWPWWVQQRVALQDAQGAAQLAELLAGASRVVGWVSTHPARHVVHGLLEPQSWRHVSGGDLGRPASSRLHSARALAEGTLRRARFALAFRRWRAPRPTAERPVDVWFAMDAGSWIETDGTWTNRYLGSFPEALEEAGVRVGWVPTVEHPAGMERQRRALQGQHVAWQGLQQVARDAASICAAAQRVHLRWARRRRVLARLQVAGMPLGRALMADVDHMLATRAHVYALTAASMRRSAPTAPLLYRNEFYPVGLAISAGAAGTSDRLAFQHGTIANDHFTYLYRSEVFEGARGMPAPDLFLTHGQATSDNMTRAGFPPDRLQVVGSLRHGGVSTATRTLEADGPDAVLLCGTLPELLPGWLHALAEGMADLPGTELWIKPHPRFRDGCDVEAVLTAAGFDRFRLVDGPLEPLIDRARVLVTDVSTTALEAAMRGCPVACFHPPDDAERLPLIATGLALAVHDGPSVERALERILRPDYLSTWEPRRLDGLNRLLANTRRSPVEALKETLAAR